MGRKEVLERPINKPIVISRTGWPKFDHVEIRGKTAYRVFVDEPLEETGHFSSKRSTFELFAHETLDIFYFIRSTRESTGFWGSKEGQFLKRVLARGIRHSIS